MDFYKRMQYVCEKIPYGRAASYGQIALLCGRPKNARQVGFALKRGLAGDHVPAHRIVNGSGFLSGAGAFEFPQMQKMMLESEGIFVTETEKGWKIDLRKYGWKNTMEEAEALACTFREEGI